MPERAFHALVRAQIARLEAPGVQCVDLVYEELCAIAARGGAELDSLARRPRLRARVLATVTELLRSKLEPCQRKVRDQIDAELAYINTRHPDFVTSRDAVSAAARENVRCSLSLPLSSRMFSR